jgi:hypothetical protein
MPFERFSRQKSDYLRHEATTVFDRLDRRPEHDDPGIVARRKRPNVREIKVQCHNRSTLGSTDLRYTHIRLTCHELVGDRHRIVSGLTEVLGGLDRHVLVDFELHHAPTGIEITRSRASSAAYARTA